MFISNGYVYGGEPNAQTSITKVRVLPDHMIIFTFRNGEERLFDATALTGPAFEPLKDESILMQCTLDHGVPTWLNGDIDCAPEFIYAHSYEYSQVSGL